MAADVGAPAPDFTLAQTPVTVVDSPVRPSPCSA